MKKLEYTCQCGNKNTREDIEYAQTAKVFYNITFNKDGTINECDEQDKECYVHFFVASVKIRDIFTVKIAERSWKKKNRKP